MIARTKLVFVLTLIAAMSIVAGCASTSGGGADQALMDDLLTERKIYTALKNDAALSSQSIFVSCINGVVTLSGKVNSGIERELAARVAKSVGGVQSVNNNLTTET